MGMRDLSQMNRLLKHSPIVLLWQYRALNTSKSLSCGSFSIYTSFVWWTSLPLGRNTMKTNGVVIVGLMIVCLLVLLSYFAVIREPTCRIEPLKVRGSLWVLSSCCPCSVWVTIYPRWRGIIHPVMLVIRCLPPKTNIASYTYLLCENHRIHFQINL